MSLLPDLASLPAGFSTHERRYLRRRRTAEAMMASYGSDVPFALAIATQQSTMPQELS